MVTKFKLKKGDQVVVTTGKDKGKIGKISSMILAKSRAIVEGINIVKKHTKPSATNPGGINQIEKSVHISNLAFWDSKNEKRTKLGFQTDAEGKKHRVMKSSGEKIAE